jgi:hypothetical protein
VAAEIQRELAAEQAGMHRELEEVQREIQLAQFSARAGEDEVPEPPDAPDLPEPPGMPEQVEVYMSGIGGGGSSAPPLVIATDKKEAAEVSQTQEDLAIMSRILSKAAGHAGDRDDMRAMGIPVVSFGDTRRPQAMYLEGYGAVFTLNVGFPLVAPAAASEKKNTPPANTTWDQTRKELYGGGERGARSSGMNEEMLRRYGLPAGGRPPRQDRPFDKDRVERLKREVIDALKNASNIRTLKGDEQVIVAISSNAGGPRKTRTVAITPDQVVDPATGMPASAHTIDPNTGMLTSGLTINTHATGYMTSDSGNTLVIRVKKSAIDTFAAGKCNAAEFTEKAVKTMTY